MWAEVQKLLGSPVPIVLVGLISFKFLQIQEERMRVPANSSLNIVRGTNFPSVRAEWEEKGLKTNNLHEKIFSWFCK